MNDGPNSGHHDDRAASTGQPAGWGGQPSWGPPTSPYLPPPPPRPPRRFRAKHAWLLAVGVCGLILAVVAGTMLWQNRADDRAAEAEAHRAPFYLAVHNLAQEPVARYTGAARDGTARELTVTDAGDAHGHLTVDGSRMPVLIVGGKTYVKPPRSMLTGLPNGLTAQAVEGKWVTGHSALARTLADVPSSPAALATRLWTGLDRTRDFPDSDAAKVRIDGVEALSVTTPDGVLSVAATPPYRVLKLDSQPSTGGQTSSGAARMSLARMTPARMAPARAPGSTGLGNLAITPLSPDDVGKAYDDLIDRTRTLRDAVDLGIRFDFNQSGNLSCSQTCTVTERVVTSTTAAPGAKLSGTVNASMTAQVTVNGQSGGGCSRTATLPINGTGTMSCVAAGTAPVVQRIKAQKQQEANARARATGRSVRIPYTLNFRAQVQISAMAFAKAEIEQKVRDQQADRTKAVETARENAGPNPDCSQDSFVAGTRVLTADAGAEPIENIEVGDAIGNATPGSRDIRTHRVTAVVTKDTDRDFVELTIAGPRGSRGTLRPTAHHLFYDVTTAAWTRADDLRPGDRVQTTGAGVATVEGTRAYRAAARTYNLSVERVHTYYVLAGDIPVLVHNCAMKRDARTLKGIKVPKQYEGLDIAHVRQNHFPGGSGVHSRKGMWPANMTNARLEDIARQALRNNPKITGFDPNTGMVRATAVVEGKLVQFQFPRGGGPIRSIYPIDFWSE